MSIFAKPNLNGNSPEDFKAAAIRINAAAMEVQEALKAAHEVFHGRNYQTVEHRHSASADDTIKLQAMHAKARELIEFAADIFEAGQED